MLAEIKGKISRTGSNLSERLEDNLTGQVFGALRYIPFPDAMGRLIANTVYPQSLKTEIEQIQTRYWSDAIEFWPYDLEGELDALLTFEDVLIGIEVKFLSGLSSVDEIDYDPETMSKHQLAREARIVYKKGVNKKKLLLFIADRHMCQQVSQEVAELKKANRMNEEVTFGYVAWQDFLHELKQLSLPDPFQQVIIRDLIDLLTRKGFEDFIDMKISDAPDIDEKQYYRFDGLDKLGINFRINTPVNGGLYYEFD